MRTPLVSALFLAATAVLYTPADARAQGAQADPAKVAIIRQILDQTHAADQVVAAIEASVPTQRASNPKIPGVFWDRFVAQARVRKGEFIDSMVPVYARTFELSELKALLQFYQSPLGKRLLATQPALMQESMAQGQRWGARLGMEIGQQLASEGVQFPH